MTFFLVTNQISDLETENTAVFENKNIKCFHKKNDLRIFYKSSEKKIC